MLAKPKVRKEPVTANILKAMVEAAGPEPLLSKARLLACSDITFNAEAIVINVQSRQYRYEGCQETFTRRYNLDRHLARPAHKNYAESLVDTPSECDIFTYLYVDTTEPDDKVTVPEVDPLYDELDKDGALLLDFITQGPSYEPFTKVEKVCVRQTFLHSRHIRYVGRYTRVWSLKRNGLLKDNDIGRVLNMLIQRKIKATQSS
ncbi:hypothetical protein EMCRGX_G025413 [Ephydatia muelleri]